MTRAVLMVPVSLRPDASGRVRWLSSGLRLVPRLAGD
jgi:hypothetical protein